MNRGAIGHRLNRRRHRAGGLLPETKAYRDRVEADGGVVIDLIYVDAIFRKLKDMGVYNNLLHWVSAKAGVKKDASNYISKLYSLIDGTDETQLTGANQPLATANDRVSFDGVDDFTSIPNANLAVTASMVLGMWVKTTTTSNLVIFEKGGTNDSLHLHTTNVSTKTGAIYIGTADTTSRIHTPVINDGTFHYVTFSYDSGTGMGKTYGDGVNHESGTMPAIGSNTADWFFGSRNGTSGFPGEANDLHLFNTAITDAQVTELYNLTSAYY